MFHASTRKAQRADKAERSTSILANVKFTFQANIFLVKS